MAASSRATVFGARVVGVPPIAANGESLLRMVAPSKLRSVSLGASVRLPVTATSDTSASDTKAGAPIETLLAPSTRITAAFALFTSDPSAGFVNGFGPIETLPSGAPPKATVIPPGKEIGRAHV